MGKRERIYGLFFGDLRIHPNIKLKHLKCVKYDKSWFIQHQFMAYLWICLHSGSFKIAMPFDESSEKLINRNASVRTDVGK
jgi:hypothetical protein